MILSQKGNCNLVSKSNELLCLTFLTVFVVVVVFLSLTLALYLIKMMTTCLSFEKHLILSLRHFKAILFSEMSARHLEKVGLAALTPAGHKYPKSLSPFNVYSSHLICVEFEAG